MTAKCLSSLSISSSASAFNEVVKIDIGTPGETGATRDWKNGKSALGEGTGQW